MFFIGLKGVTNNFFITDGELLTLTVPNNIYSVSADVAWTYYNYQDNTILNLSFSNLNNGLIDISCNVSINNLNIKINGLLPNQTYNQPNYLLTATVQYGSGSTLSTIFITLPGPNINTIYTCNITYQCATIVWSYYTYSGACNLNILLSNADNTGLLSNVNNILIGYKIQTLSNLNYASNYNYQLKVYDPDYYGNYNSSIYNFQTLPLGTINTIQTCNITWGSIQAYWSYLNYPPSCNVLITLSNTVYNSYTPSQVSNIQMPLSNNTVTFSNMSNASNYTVRAQVLDQWYSNYTITTPVFTNLPHGIINTLQTCNITWGSVQAYWSYLNYPPSCNVSITLSNTSYNSYTPSQISNIPNISLSNSTVIFSNLSNASNYTVTAQVLDQWYSNYTITTPITPLPYGIINSIGTCNITYQSAQIYWTYSNYPGSCNSIINLFNNNTIIQTSNNPLSNNTIIMNNLDWANNYIAQIIVYDQWYSNSILNSIQFTTSNEGFIYDLTTCNINYNSAVLAWSNVNYPPDTQVTLIITSPFGESTASSTSFTIT